MDVSPSTTRVLIYAGLSVALLVACRAGPSKSPRERVEAIRRAALDQPSVVQVYPVEDAESAARLARALDLEAQGDEEAALDLLTQALVQVPGEPRLLQTRAELHLALSHYKAAISDARAAFEAGPKIGELCVRSWLTIDAAQRARRRARSADFARENARRCGLQAEPRL